MKIGVAISTYKRPEIFKKTYSQWKKYLPAGAVLIVVSDADDKAPKEANFVFKERAGIARVKNKCLELLDDAGCTDIFLVDNDFYPVNKDWFKPYIDSSEPHLCYIFEKFNNKKAPILNDCPKIYEDSKIVAYAHARGCMLYIKREVLDVVGGFDENYGLAMHEHIDWSNRIFNAGLTSFRYMDVVGSSKLFHCMDEYFELPSSLAPVERNNGLSDNNKLYRDSFDTAKYCEYRSDDKRLCNNAIIAGFFTGTPDPQRKIMFDESMVYPLLESCKEHKQHLILLTDEERDLDCRQVIIDQKLNPYFQRWLSIYQYLRKHTELDYVFCVDATDVVMLRNPFPFMHKGVIYCGDEESIMANEWMRQNHNFDPMIQFLSENARLKLLNCGLIGGDRKTVMEFVHKMIAGYIDWKHPTMMDMGVFNYVAAQYPKKIHGAPVNTVFKKYDLQNERCWFAHK